MKFLAVFLSSFLFSCSSTQDDYRCYCNDLVEEAFDQAVREDLIGDLRVEEGKEVFPAPRPPKVESPRVKKIRQKYMKNKNRRESND